MEDDESHALLDPLVDPFYDLIGDLFVCHMSPPDEHVGVVQDLFGQAMLRHIQGSSGHFQIRFFSEESSDGAVNALRVDLRNGLFSFFVKKFVPYRYMELFHKIPSFPTIRKPDDVNDFNVRIAFFKAIVNSFLRKIPELAKDVPG